MDKDKEGMDKDKEGSIDLKERKEGRKEWYINCAVGMNELHIKMYIRPFIYKHGISYTVTRTVKKKKKPCMYLFLCYL